jgi:hypothetical protein
MKKLVFVLAVALTACGGSSVTEAPKSDSLKKDSVKIDSVKKSVDTIKKSK